MNVVTIILPLGAFALAILGMIRQGQEAKKDYQRRKTEKDYQRRKTEEEKRAEAIAREDRLSEELGSSVNAASDQESGIGNALRGSGQTAMHQQHFQKPGQA